MGPLSIGSPPTQGQKAVRHLTEAGGGPVSEGSQIGNQSQVPENQGDREIGGNGEDVPKEGAAEVLPDGVGVGDGKEEPGKPDAAHVECGEDTRADHGKNGHGLSGTIDRGAPFLAGEKENGGNQGSGVSDTDPEHEVGDIPCPADGNIQSPDTDPGGNKVGQHCRGKGGHCAKNDCGDPPPERGRLFHNATNVVGDPGEGAVVRHQRLPLEVVGGLGECGLGGGIIGSHLWDSSGE